MITNLGTGTLTWMRDERVRDRYGAVYLMDDGIDSTSPDPAPSRIDAGAAKACQRKRGRLIALVLETRQSTHIGDLFRGFAPQTPEKGEEIIFGEGSLFTEDLPDGGIAVGLRPADGRTHDWLDPRALYRAHEQTVELRFVEGDTQ